MKIKAVNEKDFDRIIEIWESAVRATHFFLNENDINYYRPQIREVYLHQVDLLGAFDDDGLLQGFMGLSPKAADHPERLEMLFVHDDVRGQGLGRALIESALALAGGELELEVNEQNPGGLLFYEKMGFEIIGRQEVDSEGRPFPLLKMRHRS